MSRLNVRFLARSHRLFSTSRPAQLPNLNQSVPSGGPESPAEYCAALVKKLDPEAWLCSYFWPKDVRSAWLGWRAFNVSSICTGLMTLLTSSSSFTWFRLPSPSLRSLLFVSNSGVMRSSRFGRYALCEVCKVTDDIRIAHRNIP